MGKGKTAVTHNAYEILKDREIRITAQREAILELLISNRGKHLDAEDIHDLLVSEKRTGLATVYRTLDLFENKGLVTKLLVEGSPARYEYLSPDRPVHHHLVCLICGRVQEIDGSCLECMKQTIARTRDFKVGEKPVRIYGYCGTCKSSRRNA